MGGKRRDPERVNPTWTLLSLKEWEGEEIRGGGRKKRA